VKTRVAIYTRVSTGDQEAENQLTQLQRFAKSQKWQVVQIFKDVVSGGRADRKQFQVLMAAASQRRLDVILFWSLDRFSREGVAQTLRYLQLLESWGVGFRSFTEPYLDSLGVFKDAILALLATFAKQERIRISERTKAGLARARAKGRLLGRPRVSSKISRKAVVLRKSGLSFPNIARRLRVSTGTAYNLTRAQIQ
jgi:DNA invertase Pin-like site-specific DNA recombinase